MAAPDQRGYGGPVGWPPVLHPGLDVDDDDSLDLPSTVDVKAIRDSPPPQELSEECSPRSSPRSPENSLSISTTTAESSDDDDDVDSASSSSGTEDSEEDSAGWSDVGGGSSEDDERRAAPSGPTQRLRTSPPAQPRRHQSLDVSTPPLSAAINCAAQRRAAPVPDSDSADESDFEQLVSGGVDAAIRRLDSDVLQQLQQQSRRLASSSDAELSECTASREKQAWWKNRLKRSSEGGGGSGAPSGGGRPATGFSSLAPLVRPWETGINGRVTSQEQDSTQRPDAPQSAATVTPTAVSSTSSAGVLTPRRRSSKLPPAPSPPVVPAAAPSHSSPLPVSRHQRIKDEKLARSCRRRNAPVARTAPAPVAAPAVIPAPPAAAPLVPPAAAPCVSRVRRKPSLAEILNQENKNSHLRTAGVDGRTLVSGEPVRVCCDSSALKVPDEPRDPKTDVVSRTLNSGADSVDTDYSSDECRVRPGGGQIDRVGAECVDSVRCHSGNDSRVRMQSDSGGGDRSVRAGYNSDRDGRMRRNSDRDCVSARRTTDETQAGLRQRECGSGLGPRLRPVLVPRAVDPPPSRPPVDASPARVPSPTGTAADWCTSPLTVGSASPTPSLQAVSCSPAHSFSAAFQGHIGGVRKPLSPAVQALLVNRRKRLQKLRRNHKNIVDPVLLADVEEMVQLLARLQLYRGPGRPPLQPAAAVADGATQQPPPMPSIFTLKKYGRRRRTLEKEHQARRRKKEHIVRQQEEETKEQCLPLKKRNHHFSDTPESAEHRVKDSPGRRTPDSASVGRVRVGSDSLPAPKSGRHSTKQTAEPERQRLGRKPGALSARAEAATDEGPQSTGVSVAAELKRPAITHAESVTSSTQQTEVSSVVKRPGRGRPRSKSNVAAKIASPLAVDVGTVSKEAPDRVGGNVRAIDCSSVRTDDTSVPEVRDAPESVVRLESGKSKSLECDRVTLKDVRSRKRSSVRSGPGRGRPRNGSLKSDAGLLSDTRERGPTELPVVSPIDEAAIARVSSRKRQSAREATVTSMENSEDGSNVCQSSAGVPSVELPASAITVDATTSSADVAVVSTANSHAGLARRRNSRRIQTPDVVTSSSVNSCPTLVPSAPSDGPTSAADTVARSQEDTRCTTVARSQEDTRCTTVARVQEDTRCTTVARVQEDTRCTTVARVQEDTRCTTVARVQEDTRCTTVARVQEDTRCSTVARVQEDTRTDDSSADDVTGEDRALFPDVVTTERRHHASESASHFQESDSATVSGADKMAAALERESVIVEEAVDLKESALPPSVERNQEETAGGGVFTDGEVRLTATSVGSPLTSAVCPAEWKDRALLPSGGDGSMMAGLPPLLLAAAARSPSQRSACTHRSPASSVEAAGELKPLVTDAQLSSDTPPKRRRRKANRTGFPNKKKRTIKVKSAADASVKSETSEVKLETEDVKQETGEVKTETEEAFVQHACSAFPKTGSQMGDVADADHVPMVAEELCRSSVIESLPILIPVEEMTSRNSEYSSLTSFDPANAAPSVGLDCTSGGVAHDELVTVSSVLTSSSADAEPSCDVVAEADASERDNQDDVRPALLSDVSGCSPARPEDLETASDLDKSVSDNAVATVSATQSSVEPDCQGAEPDPVKPAVATKRSPFRVARKTRRVLKTSRCSPTAVQLEADPVVRLKKVTLSSREDYALTEATGTRIVPDSSSDKEQRFPKRVTSKRRLVEDSEETRVLSKSPGLEESKGLADSVAGDNFVPHGSSRSQEAVNELGQDEAAREEALPSPTADGERKGGSVTPRSFRKRPPTKRTRSHGVVVRTTSKRSGEQLTAELQPLCKRASLCEDELQETEPPTTEQQDVCQSDLSCPIDLDKDILPADCCPPNELLAPDELPNDELPAGGGELPSSEVPSGDDWQLASGPSAAGRDDLVPKWKNKKYLPAGLLSDYYKYEKEKDRADVTRGGLVYAPDEHPHGLLPPPVYEERWLRRRPRAFTLPFDLWWLHSRGCLPGRDTLASWNYRKLRSNYYFDVKPPPCRVAERCSCSRPSDPQQAGCGEDCINRMMYVECGSSVCPCGDLCDNQRIQRHRWAPALVKVMTQHKGWGIVTKQDIKANSFILEYLGEIVSEKEFKRRMHTRYVNDQHHYCLNLDRGMVIDGHRMGSIGRFVNHSCAPNCEIQKWEVNGLHRMVLFSRQEIGAHCELTYDYNFSLFNPAVGQVCKCGAEECRGVIGGRSQRVAVQQLQLPDSTAPSAEAAAPAVPRGSGGRQRGSGRPPTRHRQLQQPELRRSSPAAGCIDEPLVTRPLSARELKHVRLHRNFLIRNYRTVRRQRGVQPAVADITRPVAVSPPATPVGADGDAFRAQLRAELDGSVRTRGTAVQQDPELLQLASILQQLLNSIFTPDDSETTTEYAAWCRRVLSLDDSTPLPPPPSVSGTATETPSATLSVAGTTTPPPPSSDGTTSSTPSSLSASGTTTMKPSSPSADATTTLSSTSASATRTAPAVRPLHTESPHLPPLLTLTDIERRLETGGYRQPDAFDYDVRRLLGHQLRVRGRGTPAGNTVLALRRRYSAGKQLVAAGRLRQLLGYLPAGFRPPPKRRADDGLDGDEDTIRCVCNLYKEEGVMIQCERCLVWQHCDCMNADSSVENYLCEECDPRYVDPEVKLIPEPEDAQPNHTHYLSLMRDQLQIRQGDCVYVMQGEQVKAAEKAGIVPYKYVDPVVPEELLIFRVEKLWKDEHGERYAFGYHYCRPQETFHEPTRRFYPAEVLRSPLYEPVPLQLVVGRCWVLDLTSYCKGRPLGAREPHVYVCDLRVDRHARMFTKCAAKSRQPVCTKAFAFDAFPARLRLAKTCVVHAEQASRRLEERAAARVRKKESAPADQLAQSDQKSRTPAAAAGPETPADTAAAAVPTPQQTYQNKYRRLDGVLLALLSRLPSPALDLSHLLHSDQDRRSRRRPLPLRH